MNKTIIIYTKAVIAFCVPFFTALGAAYSPYIGADVAQPTKVGWLVITLTPLVAGLSALGSFLSRSYADHMDAQDDEEQSPALPVAKTTFPPVIQAASTGPAGS
jgi:hypothetical protein